MYLSIKIKKVISSLFSALIILLLLFYFVGGKEEIRHTYLTLINGSSITLNNNALNINSGLASILKEHEDSFQLVVKDSMFADEIVLVRKTKYGIDFLINNGVIEKNSFAKRNGCLAYRFREPEKVGFNTILFYENKNTEIVTDQIISVAQVNGTYCELLE